VIKPEHPIGRKIAKQQYQPVNLAVSSSTSIVRVAGLTLGSPQLLLGVAQSRAKLKVATCGTPTCRTAQISSTSKLMSETDKNAVWNTGITRVEPNKVAVRGYDIAELMGRVSFGAAVYLILTGELPLPAVARLMDAILVSSIDHGATPPSALAARTVASTGASLSASVAAGIMSINRHHGGAIEDCARQLKKIADRATTESISMDEAAARTLAAMKEAGERMPGFGHRYHTKDPRTARLFELAREAGVDGAHMKAARAVEKSFADAKKALPINVDGAIGAILADLGMNPAAFNGIFMIARTPGLVAHVIEEQTREKPMRRIDPINHGYDGPPPRSLTTNEHE